MLAVVDTNVWVSAFLTPAGTSAKLLAAFRNGLFHPAFSNPILAEYQEVLGRPKFRIAPEAATEFLERLRAEGRHVTVVPALTLEIPDDSDAPFIELAVHLKCPIITGNTRHFPAGSAPEVQSPGEFLASIARIS